MTMLQDLKLADITCEKILLRITTSSLTEKNYDQPTDLDIKG